MTVEIIEERASHRRIVIRAALLYTPLTIGTVAVLSISIASLLQGRWGAILPAIVVGLIAFALIIHAIAAIRDLASQPTFTRGPISRLWAKGTLLFFFRSHYAFVRPNVFVISAPVYIELEESDVIEVHHWPHSKSVIRVIKLRGEDARPSDEASAVVPLLPSGRTPYEVLGVPDRADQRTVEAGYRERSGPASDGATTAEVREAYEILRDPERRRAYDGTGLRRRTSP